MKTNMALAFALSGLSLCWSQTELPVQQRRFGAEDEQMILTKITPDLILIDIALPGMVIRPVLSSAHWSNGK
jgi:hypothetical protein